ncbi:uncharacterized protein LOC122855849 [Aphidius gifuensis]|uniref:uncharacterized protein LOC122855849 n=1 Tax=Aphidius gifuensis TaxID=684658 RepID=UPI001CDC1639|nr:uncharacterized protein LOC122855849 [Aphidius gifuensis]
MSKICLITLFVLFTVSAITARSTEFKGVESSLETISKNNQKCPIETKHGDPCSTTNDCRCGKVAMSCNAYAKRCQVVITPDELQRGKANLRPVDRTSDRARPSIPNKQCSKQSRHGDPCLSDSECCNNSSKMVCNMYAKRCQVEITAEDLQKGRANLKHVNINQ